MMRGLARAGGAGNVTLPHKERVAGLVEVASDAVLRTGACNTFWGDEDGRLHGDNTDVPGFREAARVFLGALTGAKVLLVGAGGAARAALLGLVEEGVEEVVLLNRTPERARAVARRIGGARARVAAAREEVEGHAFDLVVNATSLGLAPEDPVPVDVSVLGRVGAVMDLVYAAEPTPLLQAAARLGIRATDGREMLVHQAAEAFRLWWDVEPDVEVMRRALVEPVPA